MSSLDLMVPTPGDFVLWKGLSSEDELDAPEANVKLFLQLATDLLVLATGITEAPDPNTPVGRIVRSGICDMAWYIGTSLESRDEQFSPFSSERIGSYSYSKMATSVGTKTETGVPFFDLAVKYLAGLSGSTTATFVSSEFVFSTPYQELDPWRPSSVF